MSTQFKSIAFLVSFYSLEAEPSFSLDKLNLIFNLWILSNHSIYTVYCVETHHHHFSPVISMQLISSIRAVEPRQ